jgi:2-dehydro-3-deoxygluconokinase
MGQRQGEPMTFEVLTLGEALGCLRVTGLLQPGSETRASIAGAESNVAIGLSRLGHQVTWLGALGRDAFGDLVVRTLRAEGVQVAARLSDAPTGLVVFTERLPAVTTVDYHRRESAGSTLSPDDVDAAFAEPPTVLHLTGITPAISASARAAVDRAVDLAAARGTRICLDLNFRSRLWSADQARAVLAPIAARADIVIASDDELGLALAQPPESTQEQVDALLQSASEVVVKLGADGAVAHTSTERVAMPAVTTAALDVVGAGDAFVAGFLSGTLDGLPLAGRLERGVQLGAFAVSTRGDWEGLPRRHELGLLGFDQGEAVR